MYLMLTVITYRGSFGEFWVCFFVGLFLGFFWSVCFIICFVLVFPEKALMLELLVKIHYSRHHCGSVEGGWKQTE